MFKFETGTVSHTGVVRNHNEDSCLAQPDAGLWVVADGMGGHHGGDYASALIVEHLERLDVPGSAPDLQARFLERITDANKEIHTHGAQVGAIIGSTVVALLAFGEHYACIWSGDSRIYVIRDGRLTQLSRDHTEANELLDRGAITQEEADNWPRKNVITRAIGVSAEVDLDHRYGTLRNRDTFVLCSDGLTAHVEDAEILEIAQKHQPQRACDQLLDLTLERGATDNTTVMIVRAFEPSEAGPIPDSHELPEKGA
ncbi:MAG: protein phosphatase 2C domain-containing protein [Celeribacter sp.]|jgi:protein phosphatase